MEAYAICHGNEGFISHFENFCNETNNGAFLNYLKSQSEIYQSDKPLDLNKIKLRKLTAICDSGNKSRTIAISDYWTQCLFQPIELKVNTVMNKLFKLNNAFYSHALG
jgi:hypothetical protein